MSDQPTTTPAATPPSTMSLGEALLARSEGRMSAETYEATYAPLLTAAAAAKGQPRTPKEQEHADWQAGREAKLGVEVSSAAREEARFNAAFEQMFAPAESPLNYDIPRVAGVDQTPEEVHLDQGLRAAMHAAKMPTFVGNAIAKRIDELGRTLVDGRDARFQPVTQAQAVDQHVRQSQDQLQTLWGDQHQARVEKIGEFLSNLSVKHPTVAALIDGAPHVFGDPQVAVPLWNWLDHQGRKAAT